MHDTVNTDNARIKRSLKLNGKPRVRLWANGYYTLTHNGYYVKDGVAPVDQCRSCQWREFRHNCGHSRIRHFIDGTVVSCRARED